MPSIKSGIFLKSEEELKIMSEGGEKLKQIKKALKDAIKPGVSAEKIENLATKLIKEANGEPSFKMVPGYFWSTCVNVNQGLVHGIPHKSIIFKKGDLVSVDIGMYYKGFHTDTSFSVGLDLDNKTAQFLKVGEKALEEAINAARVGNRIYDISFAIEQRISKAGFSPIKTLVGHGVGRNLHEEPQIPCFVAGDRLGSPQIKSGMTLAIEIMYAQGSADVKLENDGWTIATRDDKISALLEETISVTSNGPSVLT